MDGVPYLTQCPVPFGESFRYSFRVEDEGTHFYHSHAGNQKTDGAFGALIVRGLEEENPNAHTYDFDLPEFTILMNDWMHQSADDHMPGYEKRSLLSQSVLINGHGRFFNVMRFKDKYLYKISNSFFYCSKRLRLRLKLHSHHSIWNRENVIDFVLSMLLQMSVHSCFKLKITISQSSQPRHRM